MTTTLQQELTRWHQELDRIAETGAADGWQARERRLAETQHTITTYRAHVLPLLTGTHPYDVIVADEIATLVTRLEELRTDLYGGTRTAPDQEVAEIIAALRTLARVVARYDATLQNAG